MTRRKDTKSRVADILGRLNDGLTELVETTAAKAPSGAVRRRLDADLRAIITRAGTLLREIDPIRHPHFVFDPGDPAVVGRFVALAMIAQPRVPLSPIERSYGSGVYALYYKGDFAAYAPISGTETPIYVGKADPQTETAKTPVEQGDRLSRRLKDHLRSVGKAEETLDVADFECRSLVVQSGWQGAAEDYLIHLFQPIWNNETRICYGLGKHGDAASTRANKRSPWDTLHPGRRWAWSDPDMPDARSRDQILADLEGHFSAGIIYRNVDQVLKSFIDELRQL